MRMRWKMKKVKIRKEQKAVRKEAESLFKNFCAGEKRTAGGLKSRQRSLMNPSTLSGITS
jgi:hypothetical protein